MVIAPGVLEPRLQLFDIDLHILSQAPFVEAFGQFGHKRSNPTVYRKILDSVWEPLHTEYWVGTYPPFLDLVNVAQEAVISDYWTFCLGGDTTPEDFDKQIEFFVELLWLRFRHQDSELAREHGYKILLKAQTNLLFTRFKVRHAKLLNS